MIGKKKKKKLDAKALLKIANALEPDKTVIEIYAETTAAVSALAPGIRDARSSAQRQSNIKKLTPVIERVLMERISSQVSFSADDERFVALAERLRRDPTNLANDLLTKMMFLDISAAAAPETSAAQEQAGVR